MIPQLSIQIDTPIDLISLFDEHVREGAVDLYPWQVKIQHTIGTANPTSKAPYRLGLVASNGSGKDKYIIAPFCLWFILTKKDGLCIVTSSSAAQLDSQTENYLRRLSFAINQDIGRELLVVKKRHIICEELNSEIRLFATDEPGKAEGYHPMTPVSEMAVVANEAKSIPDEIFEALSRCSGYNYWLEISSPGQPEGHFYRYVNSEGVDFQRVTSYDCPNHISKDEIKFDAQLLGEHSAIFRSKHLALFTSLDKQVVIQRENIDKLILDPPLKNSSNRLPLRAGIDIGAGKDETSLVVFSGNEMIGLHTMIAEDTDLQANRIVEWVKLYPGLKGSNINADDGGVGRGVIFSLLSRGLEVNRVLNQSPALNRREFLNLGAELWWKVRRLVEERLIIIQPDKKLIDQLSNRHFKQPTGGKIRLESKKEARSSGHLSPDRADALVLAQANVSIEDFQEEVKITPVFRKISVSAEDVDDRRYPKIDFNEQPKHVRAASPIKAMRKLLGIR
jgi:hypothetical protein